MELNCASDLTPRPKLWYQHYNTIKNERSLAVHEYNFFLKIALIHITSQVQGCHVVVLLSHVRRRKGWKWVWLDGGPWAQRLLLPRTEEEDSTTLGGASSPFLLPPKEEDSEESLHHSFSYDDRASKFSSYLWVDKEAVNRCWEHSLIFWSHGVEYHTSFHGARPGSILHHFPV